jgi:hypothetical protein
MCLDVPDPPVVLMTEPISASHTDAGIDIALEPHYVALSSVLTDRRAM